MRAEFPLLQENQLVQVLRPGGSLKIMQGHPIRLLSMQARHDFLEQSFLAGRSSQSVRLLTISNLFVGKVGKVSEAKASHDYRYYQNCKIFEDGVTVAVVFNNMSSYDKTRASYFLLVYCFSSENRFIELLISFCLFLFQNYEDSSTEFLENSQILIMSQTSLIFIQNKNKQINLIFISINTNIGLFNIKIHCYNLISQFIKRSIPKLPNLFKIFQQYSHQYLTTYSLSSLSIKNPHISQSIADIRCQNAWHHSITVCLCVYIILFKRIAIENMNEIQLFESSTTENSSKQYYKYYQSDATMKVEAEPATIRQLFRFADRIDVVLMVIGTLFSLGNGVSLMFYAEPFGKLVNAFAPGKDSQEIVQDALESVKLFVINSAIVFVNSWFMSAAWAITSERQMIRARKAYFESLMNQEIAWHDRNRPAQACSKMYIEISKVHQGIINNVTSILTKISLGGSGIIIALVRGWQMALVMISFLPVMMVSGFVSSYYIKQNQKFQQKTKARFDSDVIQVFDNIRTVRMLDGQQYQTKRYQSKLRKTQLETTKNSMKNKICFAVFFFCILMNYSLGFWYGAKLVSEQTINSASKQPYNVADVIIIFFTLYMSNLSLSGLPESITSFNISRQSMTRVLRMIDRQSRVKDGKQEASQKIISIIFDKVWFQYEKPLFSNFDFKIMPGVTALIGQSGSGKTTIINLILRFYDIFGGNILFETSKGKQNLKNISFDSLRKRIGYVGQQPVLIGKTLKQALTAQQIPEDQIISLLKKVKAWDFVSEIGLDSEYSMLSGGQKQRIAIARALIKNPQILILDEGTSALDRKTQQQVLHSIKKMKIPFVIMVAHRMQTVINADRIVKLEKGQITAQGTYQQLVQHGILQQLDVNKEQQESQIQSMHDSSILKQRKQKQDTLKIIQEQHQNKQKQGEEQPEKDQKQFHMKYICKLMAFNKKIWYLYLIGIVGSFFIGAIFPTFAYLLSNILVTLTGIAYEKDPNKLIMYQEQVKAFSISLFLLSLGALVIVMLRGISFAYLTEILGEFLKKSSFRTSINKSMVEIDNYGAQNLGTIITTNCQDLKHLGGHHLGDIIENATTILVGLAIAFAFSWQITLIALGVFPLIILSGKLQMSFNHGMQSNSDKVHKKTHLMVIQSVMYIKTVKSLGLQHRIIRKYSQYIQQALKLAVKYGNLAGIMFGLGQTLISCLLSLIFFFGALLIKQEVVTVLNLYTAIYAIMFAGVQAGGNMLFLGKLAAAKYAACIYFQVIDPQNQSLEQSVHISNNRVVDFYHESHNKIQGNIQLNDVEFKYANREKPIFKNFSLRIKKGQKVALVGESGSGKSTITNILFRIYDPVSGQVLVDGQNINNYSLNNLRRQLGIVSQEPALFNRSIYDNIRYNTNATFEEVVAASKMAKAYEFILQGNFGMKEDQNQEDAFEDEEEEEQTEEPRTEQQMGVKVKGGDFVKIQAFNKKVGTRGSYLSGGQKQRIAIARALIRNPSVIVLDEATSALDNQNQKMVQQAIEQIKDVTQIIIAHRLSTVQHCDKIVVMKKGHIVQQGKYHELLKKGGYFYRLVNAIAQKDEKMSILEDGGYKMGEIDCASIVLEEAKRNSNNSNNKINVKQIGDIVVSQV